MSSHEVRAGKGWVRGTFTRQCHQGFTRGRLLGVREIGATKDKLRWGSDVPRKAAWEKRRLSTCSCSSVPSSDSSTKSEAVIMVKV